MGKSSNHRKENTFKFQTFSERIASINIDVIHQIKHHDDTPEETGTYFGEALEKQSELNYTDHFTSFSREITQHVQTYAQLVHHEADIVAALKKHLLVPDSMALPSLLDLVVQLARDLQTDFYPHFKDFFDILVKLLNRYTQTLKVLESIFTCLSYLFKFLWRYLVKDIQMVYGYFSSLLGQQYKVYVRNFAAESFAFLMRKVKDPGALFRFMFTSLEQEPDKSAGIGRLMFEMIKGVKKQFHSCSVKVFPLLLSKLGPDGSKSHDMLPWQLVESALATTLSAMAQHSDREHLAELWEILLAEVKTISVELQKESKKSSKLIKSAHLERLVRLTSVWVGHRNGTIISKPDTVAKVLLELLSGPMLPDTTGTEVLQLTSLLLTTSYSRLAVEITSKLIPQVYKTSYPLESMFTFTSSLYQLPIFEKDVLPALLPYCQNAITMDTRSCDLALLQVTQMLLEKAPLPTDGSALESAQTYLLDFGTRSTKDNFPRYIVSSLVEPSLDNSSAISKLWAALVCLPHVRPLPDEGSVKLKLSDLIKKLQNISVCQEASNRENVQFLLSQALVTMVMMLDNKEVFDLVAVELVMSSLKNSPGSVHTLRMADVYFTHAAREEMLDLLSLEIFGGIFPVLQYNLSSPHSQVRLLTLRIFSSFGLPVPESNTEQTTLDVFTICLNAEQVPVTVHGYREKLLYLQRLEYNQIQGGIPIGPYHQVPLRYLIGCLFVNFKLLWEPIRSLIASHAHNIETAAFWEVFGPALQLAMEKSEESLTVGPVSDAETSPSDADGTLPDVFSHQKFMLGTGDSKPDYTNFRFHLWKSMHSFSDKCEPRTREFVPLFFRFLKNEYYLTDLTVAPTQNLLKSETDTNNSQSLVENMDTDAAEVSSGGNESMKKKTKYNLRSNDMETEISGNEVEIQETETRRVRTRSQCSNTSELEDIDSSPDRKGVSESRTRKGIKLKCFEGEIGEKGVESDGPVVSRRRTRSQCSNSDLEELDFSVVKNKSKKVLDKKGKSIEPVIPEESDMDSNDETVASPKHGTMKKGKKKSKVKEIKQNADETPSPKKGFLKKGKKNLKENENDLDVLNVKEENQDEIKGAKKKRKAAKSSLIVQLELFSKFKNPRTVYMEAQLRQLYFDLLVHKSAEVQKVAFSCIMSYKYKYLTPYRDNFERLLEDKSFKDEIVLFSIDNETSVVSSEHRPEVLPILMRILYGKMNVKTGKGTTGRQYGNVRQSIILRFLNGCSQNELETFTDLLFAPFQHFLTEDPHKMVLDIRQSIDFTKVLPVRKLQGVLTTIDVIFKKLGHLMDGYLPKLLQIIVGMATICSLCLKNRSKLIPNVLNMLKNIRQLAIYRLIQIFTDYDKYEWNMSEIDAVFEAVVWPQLEKLHYEGLYHPTPLLKLFHCWSKQPRCFSLLANRKTGSDLVANHSNSHDIGKEPITPLPHVFKLLLNPDASKKVKAFIMEIVENLLLPLEADELKEVTMIEVSLMIMLPSLDMLNDENLGVRLLLPHLGDILTYIKGTVDNLKTQLNKRQDSCKELNILSRISAFVRDPDQCTSLVNLLLPFLGRKASRSQKTEEDVLTSVLNMIRLLDNRGEFLLTVSRLFSTLSNRNSRGILCDILQAVCEGDEDLASVAGIITKLNAWDKRRMDEPDYTARLEGFQEANSIIKQMVTIETQTCLTLIYNCCYFINTVEDMSLRDNSTHCLVTTVTQFGHGQYDQDQYNKVIGQGLLPEVKLGLRNKSETVRHEFTTILVAIVEAFGDQSGFSQLKALRDKDLEADFYENINHIQMHKRSRALRRLIKYVSFTQLRVDVILSYFLPIVSGFLTDEIYKKHPTLQDAAVDAIGCLCKQLPWKQYLHQLKYYLHLLPKKLESQKLMVRVIVSILDAFHFDLSGSQLNVKLVPTVTTEQGNQEQEESPEPNQSEEMEPENQELETSLADDVAMATNEEVRDSGEGKSLCSPQLATKIHTVILENVIRHLHRILVEKVKSEGEHKLTKSKYAEDEEILRVPIALAMVKLLQNLPKGALERYLPGILLKVCNFLRSRALDIRNTARDTLVKILTTLGTRFFPYILYELKGTLKRGYQRHVLCYTVHQLLKKMEGSIQPGDIDVCLKTLQEIFNEEIFGEVAEEKEVDGITTKLFEAKSSKSYESYELMARYIGKGSLVALVEPLKKILDSTHSHKSAKKVQDIMKRIVIGLMENTAISVETLLIFIHGLTTETLPLLQDKKESKEKAEPLPGQKPESCLLLPEAPQRGGNKPKSNKKTNLHVMVEFGLQILNQCLKRQKIVQSDKTHLQMIDPLVPMMAECLYSKYVRVNTCCVRGLCWILKFPLPSLEAQITKISSGIFILLRNYASAGAAKGDNMELVSMLFKAVTVLVRDVKCYKIEMSQLQVLVKFREEDLLPVLLAVTVLIRDVKYYKIETSQLQVLMTFCEEDLHDYNRQSTAFSLLKAILSRKLNVPEIHELMKKVEEMSITADSPHVRRECRQVTLQYLLDYPLGKKLQSHLEFYVTQLSYEMETGRESALEMMAAFFSAFPQELLSKQAPFFFIPMSASLVNDDSAKCRKLTGLAIKSLLEKIDNNDRTSLFTIVIKWLMDKLLRHRTLAAQLCGLFVEVEGAKFQQRLTDLLPVIEQQLEPGKYEKLERQSVEHDQDRMLYNMLNSLTKILRDCSQVIRDKKWRENMNVIWEHVQSHLSYPHVWVQLAASQLYGLLFAAWQPDQLVTMETSTSLEYLRVDGASKLKTLALEFITQLQSELLNEDLASQAVKNLLFLAKVAKHLDQQGFDEEGDKKRFSVVWLVRKMVREAHHEAIRNVKVTLKRKSVYKWLAAVSLDLGETGLPSVLHIMIPPLQRDISNQSTTQDASLKSLAQEVLDMLKKVVGIEKFTEVYANTQKVRAERKGERKRKQALQAVTDPEVAARKKIKKQLAKKEAKKRRLVELKPSKKAKKQRYQEFTVAD